MAWNEQVAKRDYMPLRSGVALLRYRTGYLCTLIRSLRLWTHPGSHEPD